MPETRYYVRPESPECVAWRDCPAWVEALMEAMGLVPVDESAYRVLLGVWERNGANQRRDG